VHKVKNKHLYTLLSFSSVHYTTVATEINTILLGNRSTTEWNL